MGKILAALLIFSSCALAQESLHFGNGDVIGHRFVLVKSGGDAFSSEREVFIQFNKDMTLAGMICNRFSGPFVMTGTILKAENLASTRMACPGVLGELENDMFKALRGGVSVFVNGDALELRRDDKVWEFRRAAAAAGEATSSGKEEAVSTVKWDDLAGGKFVLATADGEAFAVEMGTQPFIQFGDNNRVNGSACNNFMGPGELEDGTLFVRNAASTMMMCVDPKLSGYERDFHQLLQSGAKIALDGDSLTLTGNGKTYVYTREK